jgi:uncharacterized phage protein gp47/JayE
MPSFQTPTFEESAAFIVASFARLFPEDDTSATSFNFLWCLLLAAALTDAHAHLDAVETDLLPDTAGGAELERWAAIRGVTKKGATPARKADALLIVGTPATIIPAGTALRHNPTGMLFEISALATVEAGGTVLADVAAINSDAGSGAATRLNAGEILTFTTPIANVEEQAELQLDLDEDGEDAESDGALRLRVLSRFSDPPLGGAQVDYEQWALEETGIAAAYAYPLRGGLGTVDVAALHAGTGAARILTEPERADLQAKIDAKRPVSVKAFRVLTVLAEETDIEVTYKHDGSAENAPDWDDSTPPTVLAWEPGAVARKLQFAGGARPATMQVGDRIIIKRADGTGTGKERVVESFDGVDAVILEADALGDIPAAADTVYSGGPLVELQRQAIQELVNSLGTANPDSNRYGTWEGSLRLGKLTGAAESVEGVLEATAIAPAATVHASDPAYPDDDEVGLIIAGRIIVRSAH